MNQFVMTRSMNKNAITLSCNPFGLGFDDVNEGSYSKFKFIFDKAFSLF